MATKPMRGPGGRAMHATERPKNTGKTMRRTMAFILKHYKWHCLAVVICIVLTVLAQLNGTLFLQKLYDSYLSPMLESGSTDFTPLLHPTGSPFRQAVWQLLLEIPYGQMTTYGALAKRLGGVHMSAQAVGGAVGHNPISIIVPCHRVVGANGSLTGYAGGLERKIRLLEIEQTDMHGLFRPTKGTAI